MKYYIFSHTNPHHEYFKKSNYTFVNIDDYNDYSFESGSIVIYEMHNIKLKLSLINILLLTNPIVDLSGIINFTYYIPINPSLFYKYSHKFGIKLLIPINLLQDKTWNLYYCSDELYKQYKNIINGIYSKKTFGVLIYNNTNELSNITLKSQNIFEINEKTIRRDIWFVNNYLNFAKKIINNKEVHIPENKKYRLMTFSDYCTNNSFYLKRNVTYLIVRENTMINDNTSGYLDILEKSSFNYCSFLIDGKYDYEIAIYYRTKSNLTIEYDKILKLIEYQDSRIVGTNNDELSNKDIEMMYCIYGKNKIYSTYEHLYGFEYNYYECLINFISGVNTIFNSYFNKNKFRRIFSFWAGTNNYTIDHQKLNAYINSNNLFDQKSIFLLSKSIVDYGGNQKTGLQIYKDMIKLGYNVKICCLTKGKLVNEIDKNDIINVNNLDDVVLEINNNSYEKIIVNKLNEFFNIIKKINKKSIFITHNSMDPINKTIIEKSHYLEKVLTVNSEHMNLLYENNIDCLVGKYINHIELRNNPKTRTKMSYNIVYVGRISEEKHVNLLIKSFNKFCENNSNVKLTIIGDGIISQYSLNKRIIFLGGCGRNVITYNLINSDYLILPSSTEGLPFVLLEAMSLGIPIIASNIVGINEIIEDGKNGFLFDLENYDDYKNNVDNWDIVSYTKNNNDKTMQNIIESLKKAYNIPVVKWNEMSMLCYKYIKSDRSPDVSIKKNINLIVNKHNYALITKITKSSCDTFFSSCLDIFEDNKFIFAKYDLVIKINCLDDFLEKNYIYEEEKGNRSIFLIKMNMLHKEMNDKKINQINDINSNYVICNNAYSQIWNINDINDIFG